MSKLGGLIQVRCEKVRLTKREMTSPYKHDIGLEALVLCDGFPTIHELGRKLVNIRAAAEQDTDMDFGRLMQALYDCGALRDNDRVSHRTVDAIPPHLAPDWPRQLHPEVRQVTDTTWASQSPTSTNTTPSWSRWLAMMWCWSLPLQAARPWLSHQPWCIRFWKNQERPRFDDLPHEGSWHSTRGRRFVKSANLFRIDSAGPTTGMCHKNTEQSMRG